MYLNHYLKGKAKGAIDGYFITADNHQKAIKQIKERFGCPKHWVSIYCVELNDIKPTLNAEDERNNLDQIRKILTNLLNVGTDI